MNKLERKCAQAVDSILNYVRSIRHPKPISTLSCRNGLSIAFNHSIMMGTIKDREFVPSLQLYNNLRYSRSSTEPLFHHS